MGGGIMGFDPKRAPLFHSLETVDDQIQNDLFNLAEVGLEPTVLSCRSDSELDSGRFEHFENWLRLVDEIVEVNQPLPGFMAFDQLRKTVGQIGRPLGKRSNFTHDSIRACAFGP